jgi:hypothetical protein
MIGCMLLWTAGFACRGLFGGHQRIAEPRDAFRALFVHNSNMWYNRVPEEAK